MRILNAFRAKMSLPEKVPGFYVRFEGLNIQKKEDRRAFLQSIVRGLLRKGFDATVAPEDVMDNFDLVILKANRDALIRAFERFSDLASKPFPYDSFGHNVISAAWQNKIRTVVSSKGFMKIGDRYVLETEVLDKRSQYKKAFRIQASLENRNLVIWVDARTRIMNILTEAEIQEADKMGDESEVRVRVLPHWTDGLLVGRTGKKAGEVEFIHNGRPMRIPEYWRAQHGIRFVPDNEEVLDVWVPSFGKTLPYPRCCVFREFLRGSNLPETLKKEPDERVKLGKEFIRQHLGSLEFLGQSLDFEGPLAPGDLGFHDYEFRPSPTVVVGNNADTPIDRVHEALKAHGPYNKPLNGKYIVIHHGRRSETATALGEIARAYSRLGLGNLEPLTTVGDQGYLDTAGAKVADFTTTIASLRSTNAVGKDKVLALLILPSAYSSEIYYKARGGLFERVFGTEPFPCQAFGFESVEKILSGDPGAYAIAANTATQCYIKYGGTGTAVWILKLPADHGIPGIQPGSSCYAYHDVSRRPKLKASATAYSAMTDSYGRYIATGTKPVGGERLSPSGFYDILLELIQKVAIFSQRFSQLGHDKERKFSFQRLVFAKDGVIRDDEAEMMEEVIIKGIPEEGKEPILELLRRFPMFPKKLVIDIIGVNKSPNKRLFDSSPGHYFNVGEGTALAYDTKEGLLISFSTRTGSAQPIEISLKKHLCLNYDSPVPAPHISDIMQEYYRLTKLNWASLFRQGKFALPQILTQNLGENISAGVRVPDDMPLL